VDEEPLANLFAPNLQKGHLVNLMGDNVKVPKFQPRKKNASLGKNGVSFPMAITIIVKAIVGVGVLRVFLRPYFLHIFSHCPRRRFLEWPWIYDYWQGHFVSRRLGLVFAFSSWY
jgi:hypothetical protein